MSIRQAAIENIYFPEVWLKNEDWEPVAIIKNTVMIHNHTRGVFQYIDLDTFEKFWEKLGKN